VKNASHLKGLLLPEDFYRQELGIVPKPGRQHKWVCGGLCPDEMSESSPNLQNQKVGNELLEDRTDDPKWMDVRAPKTPVKNDSDMEALEEEYGAQDN